MFSDYAKIFIKSGKGGDGHVSFRRELYVPDGGPDGGDGGKGGDVIFVVDKGLNTLTDFKHRRKYVAEDGHEGGKRRCHGANGADLIVKVPEGTVVSDAETGRIIADMSGDNSRQTILYGGRGGTGNMHYATAVMQAPKYAKPGKPGQELFVILELKSIADVGLVGYPNVGKSTFLSVVTNARPKIANYHFTTISPNLGVVDLGNGEGFVIADIPGLIDGAARGMGLGHRFLRHIERTRMLVHLIDASGSEGRNPAQDFENIMRELEAYDPVLAHLPQIIGANKIDVIPLDERKERLAGLSAAAKKRGIPVYPISAVTNEGIKEFLYAINELRKTLPAVPVVFEPDYVYKKPDDDLPYEVSTSEAGVYVVEGPLIEKMLGYTNLESEKGFAFFQKFIKERGISDELKALGISEGDTVRMYGHEFEYLEDE